MASLGGLVALRKLDMTGCRGDTGVLEGKVWAAIKARRALTPETPEMKKPPQVTSGEVERLLAEASRLRELARELLEKANELETTARKLERR